MERAINKVTAYLWLALALLCLYGAIFRGAWWHLLTASFCLLLFRLFSADSKADK